jgi:hypothetical protein
VFILQLAVMKPREHGLHAIRSGSQEFSKLAAGEIDCYRPIILDLGVQPYSAQLLAGD